MPKYIDNKFKLTKSLKYKALVHPKVSSASFVKFA